MLKLLQDCATGLTISGIEKRARTVDPIAIAQKHPASMCTEPVPNLYRTRPGSKQLDRMHFGRGFGPNLREILADSRVFGGGFKPTLGSLRSDIR